MLSLAELWLPILLSAVFVFIASSILHMVLPIHRSDYKKLPGEADIMSAIRAQDVSVGLYMFPSADSMKDAYTPEMIEKFKEGPVGIMTVLPSGPPAMGKCLVQWFLYTILISIGVGHVTRTTLGPDTAFISVFHLAAAVAVLGYAGAVLADSIWKGQPWSNSLKFVFDGVVYSLVTGATFGWLWPASL